MNGCDRKRRVHDSFVAWPVAHTAAVRGDVVFMNVGLEATGVLKNNRNGNDYESNVIKLPVATSRVDGGRRNDVLFRSSSIVIR